MKSVQSFIQIAKKQIITPLPYIVVNATHFQTETPDNPNTKTQYNILYGNVPFEKSQNKRTTRIPMHF